MAAAQCLTLVDLRLRARRGSNSSAPCLVVLAARLRLTRGNAWLLNALDRPIPRVRKR